MSAPTMSSSNTELDAPVTAGDQNPTPAGSVAEPPVADLPDAVTPSTSDTTPEPDLANGVDAQEPAAPGDEAVTTPEPATEEQAADTPAAEGTANKEGTAGEEKAAAEQPADGEAVPAAAPKPRLTELEKLQKAIPGTSYKDLPTLLALQRRLQTLMTPPGGTTAPDEAVGSVAASATSEASDETSSSVEISTDQPVAETAIETNAADDASSASTGDDTVAALSTDTDSVSDDESRRSDAAVSGTDLPRQAADVPEQDNEERQQELARLAARLEQLIGQHHEWQRKTVSELDAAVETLAKQISEGQISESQSLWDRSQSTLRRVNADDQARLQEAFAPLRAELTKLLDWRKFASSEKKKELIDKMQALVEDNTAPPQKARLIRTLQDEWKTLGHSEDNDALWTQFSDAARLAFEPCKQYFRERKELQSANLVARNNICEQLEAYVLSLQDVPEPNLGEVNRLEQQARDDWKKYAPVAQNKIKALQKRFNAVLGQLRQSKRAAIQHHNAAKSALIEQAKALLAQEDLADAIRQSKELQQQWKALGPGSFKDDRKLWAEFRAACDALFARRDDNRAEQRNAASGATAPAREALKEINELLALDDEAFAESRPRFNQASKAFRNALTPELRGGERKALQDQFNKLSKRYDTRQRLTPDRKQLQLQQQVQQRAAVCQDVEEQLLKSGEFSVPLTELEAQWASLDRIDDSELEQTLQKRFKQLCLLVEGNADNRQQATRSLAEKLAGRAREICVDAEIMSGAETPAEDKAIRMQLQLNQLQKGLGRLPTGMREQLARLQQAELLLTSTGPLEPVLRGTLKARLDMIRQRFQ